jgi:WS/DGAT/MGAT family acyltransferase
VKFENKMSDAEGLMWRLDKDPYLNSTFSSVTVLDRPADLDRLRRRLERATIRIARLRQRVQAAPGNLSPPMWVDDPSFDLDYHLRGVALPEPGTLRQLLDLASLITSDPFERTRPLWSFFVVEGLEGGRGALIQKFHHTIMDGETGVRISMEFLDLERDAPEPPPLEAPAAQGPDGAPSGDALRGFVASSLRLPIAVGKQVRDLLVNPTRIPEAGAASVATIKGVVNQLSDTEQARSPLWTERSLKRRLEVLRVPFADVKDAATHLGGSLNTAFLAGAAAAAGEYHRQLGRPVDHLRASMAISTRTKESGSNAFTLGRLLVPTGEMSPAERVAAISEASGQARAASATASLEVLASVTTVLPTTLLTRLARQQSETIDFATSNVRASPVPCYVAGARIVEIYPAGPLGGVAFNLTVLSYDGSLDMAANIDPAAVAEPERLRDCLVGAFAELVAAGQPKPASAAKDPTKPKSAGAKQKAKTTKATPKRAASTRRRTPAS